MIPDTPSAPTDSEVGERVNSGTLVGDPDEKSVMLSKTNNGHTRCPGKPPDLPGVWWRRSWEDINILRLHLVSGVLCRD